MWSFRRALFSPITLSLVPRAGFAAVERHEFATEVAYLVIEVLDDDLVHFGALASLSRPPALYVADALRERLSEPVLVPPRPHHAEFRSCELLAPVYGWFTEGFDTADLRDPKALLDALR
jgi:hypothetical protein